MALDPAAQAIALRTRPSRLPRAGASDATAAVRAAAPSSATGGAPGVVRDPLAQPDAALRALNLEEPTNGERSQVYCTKVGAARPDAMYILGAHMDGHGFGEAADDDASGTALVMELARILSAPDVETAVSIRFALWNNEETGLNGSRAYVEQRRERQGLEDPPGSGRYPEPRWLGMIQHDMMLFDHGRRDRTARSARISGARRTSTSSSSRAPTWPTSPATSPSASRPPTTRTPPTTPRRSAPT